MANAHDEREITRRYGEGARTGDLAREFGVPKAQIAKIVRRNGGEVRGRGANRLAPEAEAEMVRLYEAGATSRELRERFGVHATSISRIARRHGVEVRPQRRPERKFTPEEIAEMTRLCQEERLSQTAIAKRFDTTQVVVSRVFRERGVEPARIKRARGEKHGSWKGGRTVTEGGYVLVLVHPQDPLAAMRTRSGYVLEHRLVMARAIGRPLNRSETVHHINGDRADNRLENLQLRHGKHGKGVALRCANCGSHDIVFDEVA